MSRGLEAGLSDLAQRILDGDEIDWDDELKLHPADSDVVRTLRSMARLSHAHRLAAAAIPPSRGSSASPSPRSWGPLQILEKIGEGGYGSVFRAWDPKLEAEVALKLFNPHRPVTVEFLLAEARRLARVRHPNVLQVYGADEHDGRVGMWTELLRGRTLEDLLARAGRFGAHEATIVGIDLCRALAAVHGAGLVHGDVKTTNAMRVLGGRIVLMDFGAAGRSSGPDPAPGTPISVAPERLSGGPATRSSDLYELGVLLYRLVSGHFPIEAMSIEALRSGHQMHAAVPLRDRRPDLPTQFVRVVDRAMSPRPEDRYASAGEMEQELFSCLKVDDAVGSPVDTRAPEIPGALPPHGRRGRQWRRRRVLFAAGIAAALALAGWAAWQGQARLHARAGPNPRAAQKDWVLVAEFDGPSDEPDLTAATRNLVMAALDQSRVVASVPLRQIRAALQLAGKPDTTRVDAALARELAYRRSVRAVVEGHIDRIGRGYAVVLRVADVDDPRVVLTVSEVASHRDALIGAVERAARRLREGLGERQSAIRASRRLIEVQTPSFEAFRDYVKADELFVGSGNFARAIRLLRAAVALDPDFAAAWGRMGGAFSNLGQEDSALAAFGEALRRPQRLNDAERLMFQAVVARLRGDMRTALANLEQAVEEDPSNPEPHVVLGVYQAREGRFEEALASNERAAALSPLVPLPLVQWNSCVYLVTLGRLDEARHAASGLEGRYGREAALLIALAADNWVVADSLGAASETDPTGSSRSRCWGARARAAAEAARGEVEAAAQALRRAQATAEADHLAPEAEEARRDRLLLAVTSGQQAGLPEGDRTRDTTTAALITRGLYAAAAGDTVEARRLLSGIRSRGPSELAQHGAGPLLLEAWIASSCAEYEKSIRMLAPAARDGFEAGAVRDRVGRVPMRWLVAEDFEHLGRPDSAAAHYEAAHSPIGEADGLVGRGIAYSFAHRRLVLLYARMGRMEEARRHWEIFSKTFTRPDPEMMPLVEEARAALASAEGMARSARR